MFHTFLIKYAEIGLKGKNRYVFEDALVSHIHHSLKRLDGKFTVTKEAGRIYATHYRLCYSSIFLFSAHL